MNIILSASDNYYLDIAPITCFAWKKLFPNIKLHLGIITNDPFIYNNYIENMKLLFEDYCDTLKIYYNTLPKVNFRIQAKMVRFHLATQLENDEICMLNDIDLIPLNANYYISKLKNWKETAILGIGGNVYRNGKFPIAYMTGKSFMFKKLFGAGMSFDKFLAQWFNIEKPIDKKESVLNSFDGFSDESLIRYMALKNKVSLQHIDKTFIPGVDSITKMHKLDENKLKCGKYIEAHHLLPVYENLQKINKVCEYLDYEYCSYTSKR